LTLAVPQAAAFISRLDDAAQGRVDWRPWIFAAWRLPCYGFHSARAWRGRGDHGFISRV